MSLVFSKEVKDSNGRSKYLYKSKLFVSHVLPHMAASLLCSRELLLLNSAFAVVLVANANNTISEIDNSFLSAINC